MNTLINWAVKLSGLGWVWEKTDGAKTYIAATVGILTGLAGLITEFAAPIAAHNAGAIVALLKTLPTDPSWLALIAALGTLGIGHKLEKQNAP